MERMFVWGWIDEHLWGWIDEHLFPFFFFFLSSVLACVLRFFCVHFLCPFFVGTYDGGGGAVFYLPLLSRCCFLACSSLPALVAPVARVRSTNQPTRVRSLSVRRGEVSAAGLGLQPFVHEPSLGRPTQPANDRSAGGQRQTDCGGEGGGWAVFSFPQGGRALPPLVHQPRGGERGGLQGR
ncbi:hypothetical protein DFP73DRAFT_125181 [Morchella snyderi]|nr:hypothetical protein DFP73DRAFT_125181 [Morchella snyderi]